MKRIGKYIFAMALAAVGCNAMAQGLHSAYFVDEYLMRHNLNPAYGNDRNYVSLPGVGHVNVRTQGNFGLGDVLFDNPRYGIDSPKKKTTFMNPYISASDALKGFASGANRLGAEIDVTLLSGGFKAWGGYNTVSVDARAHMGASLPYALFEFAKNTGNQTYNIDDLHVQAQSFVQVAVGHSRNLTPKWRVGGKMKLLLGLGRGDVQVSNLRADLADDNRWTMTGRAEASVSMKGFAYKQKQKQYKQDGKGSYTYVNDVDVDAPGVSGVGLAFDLGAVWKPNGDWRLSASVVDLGFICWSNNLTAVNKQESFVFDGFHDIAYDKHDSQGNLKPNSFKGQGNKYADQLADFANLTDQGDQGSRTTGIGATIHLGAEWVFPLYRPLKIGLLSSTRLNGPYTWTEGRLSANVAPLPWLDGALSFAAGSFATSCGWVVNVHPKAFNVFIGMDHILGKVSREMIPLSSNASLNVGFNVAF